MALLILRAIFVMVSVGIAVLIFNSGAMQSADIWVPWAPFRADRFRTGRVWK